MTNKLASLASAKNIASPTMTNKLARYAVPNIKASQPDEKRISDNVSLVVRGGSSCTARPPQTVLTIRNFPLDICTESSMIWRMFDEGKK